MKARLEPLAALDGPRVAAFDADGVLWRGDVSEDFTRWMIERGDFDAGLWESYQADHARDHGAGCLSILRFYEGLDRDRLAARVDEFWRLEPNPPIAENAGRPWIQLTVDTIGWLDDHDFTIYVVSATPRPVLAPLPDHLPIEPHHILALELEFDAGGRATGKHAGVPTFGPGKATALRQATDAPIAFAAGNSAIDIDLLRLRGPAVTGLATTGPAVRWAIEPDAELRTTATEEGWQIIDFPEASQ